MMISVNILMGIMIGLSTVQAGRGFDMNKCDIVDLTYATSSKSPYYPKTYRPFKREQTEAGPLLGAPYINYGKIDTFEHIGTHVDAPIHFSKGGLTVDKVKLEQLIGEACVIHIADKVAKNKTYTVTNEDIKDWESRNGRLGSHCIVLLHTGQDKHWPDMAKYFGSATPLDVNTHRYSAFTGDVAKTLKARKVKAVGVDCISLDAHTDFLNSFGAHLVFLDEMKISGFENLMNLGKLPERGATFFAAPFKIEEGSGSPTRAFAIGYKDSDPCRIGASFSDSRVKATFQLILITSFLAIVLNNKQ